MAKGDHDQSGEKELYGTPHEHDPNFNGVIQDRSCTDIICLALLLIYVVGMVVVAAVAFIYGDPRRLIYPKDSDGRICGVDEGVENKPFLVFFDFTKCSLTSLGCNTPLVCVQSCPNYYYFAVPGAEELFNKLNLQSDHFNTFGPLCDDSVVNVPTSADRISELVKDNKCAPYVLDSTSVFGRCLPAFIFKSIASGDFQKNIVEVLGGILEKFGGDQISEEIIEGAVKFIADVGGTVLAIFQDIQVSWHVIVIGIGLGTILCFIWLCIMRYIAGFVVWGCIIAVNCILAAAAGFSFYQYMKTKDNKVSVKGFEFTLDLNHYRNLDTVWLISTCVCGLIFLILLLLTFCLCKRIRIAIALIEEASRSVTAFWSTLIWPLIPITSEIIVFVLWAVIAIYIASSKIDSGSSLELGNGTISKAVEDLHGALCGQGGEEGVCSFIHENQQSVFMYLQAYNLFGSLWLLNFVIGFSHLTLAGVFATYYWTFDKNNIPRVAMGGSLWRVVRYHLGTIAFGAAIIAAIQFIRILLEYLEFYLKKAKENRVVRYILCCLRCFFYCLEKFMKFINRNAYIMVAIYGENFCCSAKKAFSLLMRNIVRVAVVNKIANFLLFIGTLMVTAAVVLIAFFFYSRKDDFSVTSSLADDVIKVPEVRFYWAIIVLIGIGTFVVATIFVGVFDMAVDTLFLCFLEDLERNDGSAERPYFMNQSLMDICGKKNTFTDARE